MELEGFFTVLAVLRRRLFYIVSLFAFGVIGSFSVTGHVIERIKNDMVREINWNSPSELEVLYGNLTAISSQLNALAAGDSGLSGVASNLSVVSDRLGEMVGNVQSPVSFVYLTPVEVIMLRLKLSLIFGVFIALPLVFYYSYAGLKGRLKTDISVSRRFIFAVVFSSMVLFLIGAAYAYFFMLPIFLGYLYRDAAGIGLIATYSINSFIYFVVMTSLVFGLAFELPLIVVSLVRLELIKYESLSNYRRHIYVFLFIIAAWVTPPDIFSQILVALPFIVLYEISLITARFLSPHKT